MRREYRVIYSGDDGREYCRRIVYREEIENDILGGVDFHVTLRKVWKYIGDRRLVIWNE